MSVDLPPIKINKIWQTSDDLTTKMQNENTHGKVSRWFRKATSYTKETCRLEIPLPVQRGADKANKVAKVAMVAAFKVENGSQLTPSQSKNFFILTVTDPDDKKTVTMAVNINSFVERLNLVGYEKAEFMNLVKQQRKGDQEASRRIQNFVGAHTRNDAADIPPADKEWKQEELSPSALFNDISQLYTLFRQEHGLYYSVLTKTTEPYRFFQNEARHTQQSNRSHQQHLIAFLQGFNKGMQRLTAPTGLDVNWEKENEAISKLYRDLWLKVHAIDRTINQQNVQGQ